MYHKILKKKANFASPYLYNFLPIRLFRTRMEPEIDEQVPGRFKRKETSSTSVTKCQPPSNQREEEKQNGDLPPDSKRHCEFFNNQYDGLCEDHQNCTILHIPWNKYLEQDFLDLFDLIRPIPNISSPIFDDRGNTRPVSLEKVVYQPMNNCPEKRNKRKHGKNQYIFSLFFLKYSISVVPLAADQSCTSDYKFSHCKSENLFSVIQENVTMIETVFIFSDKSMPIVITSDLDKKSHSDSTGQFKLNIYNPKDFTKDIKIKIYNILMNLHSPIRLIPKVCVRWALSSLPKHKPDKQFAFAIILFKSQEEEFMHLPADKTKGPLKALNLGRSLRSLLKAVSEKHNKAGHDNKQLAFSSSFLELDDGCFSVVYPRHDSISLHSEEILIQDIDTHLSEFGYNVDTIFIYTNNSPCLTRCMPKVEAKANQWHQNYTIDTYVAFRNCWGLNGQNFSPFKDFTYSDISNSQISSTYGKAHFKLQNKLIKNLKSEENRYSFESFNHQYDDLFDVHQPRKWRGVACNKRLDDHDRFTAIKSERNRNSREYAYESYDAMQLHSTNGSLKKLCPGTVLKSIVKADLEKFNNAGHEDKQFAFAIIFWKCGKGVRSRAVRPRRQFISDDSIFLHSEEVLIEEIDRFLKKYGSNVRTVFIYSTNSPCLNRCMPKLKGKAYEWYTKYNIRTDVAFSNFWGTDGPKCSAFQSLTYSDILSNFSPHFDKSKEVRFKLRNKAFKKLKPKDILSLGVVISKVEEKNRGIIFSIICSILENMKKLSESPEPCTVSEHLGKMSSFELPTIIDSDITSKILEILKKKWIDMVEESFTTFMKGKLTTEFNTEEVYQYANRLDPNGPFQLLHLQEDSIQHSLNIELMDFSETVEQGVSFLMEYLRQIPLGQRWPVQFMHQRQN